MNQPRHETLQEPRHEPRHELGIEGWRAIAVGAGAAMFLCMGLGRFSYSAMIPALIEAGQVDAVAAGYIGGANMVGFLAGAATSIIAAKMFRLDRLLWGSIVLAVIALAASAFPFGSIWLGCWRAAVGIATGLVMVLGLAVTAQAAPPERRAIAMSYIFIGVGCGILFGGTVVPAALRFNIAAAWSAVAVAGLIVGAVAIRSWRDVGRADEAAASEAGGAHSAKSSPRPRWPWWGVVVASLLFSFGIVPHTIYWFDYIARDLGQGYTSASWHWAGVGIAAIAGPVLAARFAGAVGTTAAITLTYFVMALGIGMPALALAIGGQQAGYQPLWVLIASTIIFGAQPGVSTLLGARARDLGQAADMPGMMRTIIFANGIGSAFAGVAIPKLLDLTRSYELLFLVGGAALLVGGVLCFLTARCERDAVDRSS